MEIVDKALEAVFRAAKLPPGIDLDDIRQEVWVRLLESDFDPGERGATTYVRRVARNCIVDAIRKMRGHSPLDDAPDPRHDLHRRIESEEEQWRRIRVSELIDRLPREQRRLMRLRFERGLSYRRLSERLGIPSETLRGRVLRILSSLRESLPSSEV